jgi:hypothetical protein
MAPTRFPSLYQIPTRVWLGELSGQPGRPLPLDQVPDPTLERLADLGFDWVWFMGVWQTGPASRAVSRSRPDWRAEYLAQLPDLTDDDICGSPFAVRGYTVHADFGGNAALLRLRERLHRRGMRLMLDFVPNHTALDHPWIWGKPEFYVAGSEADLARAPQTYQRLETWRGPRVLAHGRDPYFPAWPDTVQLNYRHAGLRTAMREEVARAAELCDGVRCDMAMLLLPDVIARTWGDASKPADGSPPVDAPFWPEAITRVKERNPEFIFLAEAYWDLEWALQQQGFDYTYDKRYYDRLHARDVEAIRGHLGADPEFQRRSARFLENHDEPRAASAFPPAVLPAAAVLAYLVPGMRFFQEGQLEGRRVRLSVHLGRRPAEPVDNVLLRFYQGLLDVLRRPEPRGGRWQSITCRPAGEGNRTWNRFIAFAWEPGPPARAGEPAVGQRLVVAVNYGPAQGQCFVNLPWPDLRGKSLFLRDLTSPARYERSGDELATRGLYLDVPEWGYNVFEVASA